MAAPNILSLTTATGKTTYLSPANTNAAVLLANSASSNKVFKINQIIAANTTSTAAAATVSVNSNAAGSGTSYPIASAISVPGNASLIVVDKTLQLYLEEDKSIVVTSGTANAITFVISYEDLS